MSFSTAARLVLAIVLPSLVSAQGNSTSDPSSGNGRVGWVPSSEGRGTSDILWSCFSVLIVCSWKAVHLNIPSKEESEAGWVKSRGIPYRPSGPLWRTWFRKFAYMILVILGPDIGVGLAISQYLDAKRLLADINANGGNWTMVHAFYANMGGFAAQSLDSENGRVTCYLGMQGLLALNSVAPEKLQQVTESSIKDRSKADGFSKIFALLQCTWLLVQSIVRGCVGLAISELELATLAFVPCAFLMYVLWFEKGFDVQHITVIDISFEDFQKLTQDNSQDDDEDDGEDDGQYDGRGSLKPNRRVKNLSFDKFAGLLMPKADTSDLKLEDFVVQLFVYITGSIFSALHMIAWYWDFPSTTIATMWRCFSVIATVCSFSLLFIWVGAWLSSYLVAMTTADAYVEIFHNALAIAGACGTACHFIARIGLIVLIFYCFGSMPPAVYKTVEVSWTGYIPHFS